MDAIDRMVRDGYAAAGMKRFSGDTWEQFTAVTAGKKLFLFGAGVGTRFFYHKYGNTFPAEGVIDNNERLWGHYIYESVPEAMLAGALGMKITGSEILSSYRAEDIVVLIASLKNSCEIADELEQAGIKSYFSLLHLEINERQKQGITETAEWKRPFEQIKQEYGENLSKLPVNKKKLVFYTMSDYAGHGKEIVRQILRERTDLDIVWLVQNESLEAPKGIRAVSQMNWLACMYEVATAGFWLVDMWMPDYVPKPKREEQYYIHLTHWSSVTLKNFGFSMTQQHRNLAGMDINLAEGGKLNFILVGSRFDEQICRENYCFSGEAIHVGSPRSDILFQEDNSLSFIKDNLHIPKNHKILLYAPTYRSILGKEESFSETLSYYVPMDFKLIKMSLEKRFGGQWSILLRLHPRVAQLSSELDVPDYVINVSNYNDGEELIAISDAMVSDYSSIMFEPAFVHKPVFLLATDREPFEKEDRSFLIDYDTLPFPQANSNEELARNIESFDEDKFIHDVDVFLGQYGVHEDGHAGERAAKFILELIDGKRGREKVTGPLISIIVPIYNVAPYLARCIESIIGQTYQNLEIILVNDGSTDNSYEIAQRYAAMDSRIRLFTQKNQGVASARKRGLDAANGEWVGFVDSDDWIAPKMYERLSYFMGRFDCDMVSMGLIVHRINGTTGVWHDFYSAGFYDNLEKDIYPSMLHDFAVNKKGLRCLVFTKLYRTELLKKVYEAMDLRIFYGEDAMMVCHYCLQCKKIYIVHEPFYHYNMHENSAFTKIIPTISENNYRLFLNLKELFESSNYTDIFMPQLKQYMLLLEHRTVRMLYGIDDNEMVGWEYPSYEKLFGKRFIIYGAGKGGQRFYKAVVQRGFRQSIVAWVDKKIRGKSADKFIEIQPVETIAKVEYDYIAVAILKQDTAWEVIKELEEKWHVPSEKIVWGMPVNRNFWTIWDNMFMQEMIYDA